MSVLELLKSLHGRRIPLLRNGGNWGDALIKQGTFQLCQEVGVDCFEINETSPLSGDDLLVSGGGCCVDYYRIKLLRRLDSIVSNFKNIYLLPQTICGSLAGEWLRQSPSNVHVFCRERVSFEWASQHIPGRCWLDHDMATWFDFSPWIRQFNHPQGTLWAIRQDAERTDRKGPKTNLDLSARGSDRSDVGPFLETIAKHERIVTNRLHIAIAGMELGREVEFYANSYYKNKAVYEFTMSKRVNVRWRGM